MPYRSLRDFIERLEREGGLVRVKAPVSPHLEMTEIQTRLLAEGGPAVLFENVVGPGGQRYGMPVLVNLFGTVDLDVAEHVRMPMDEFGDEIARHFVDREALPLRKLFGMPCSWQTLCAGGTMPGTCTAL